MTSRCGAARHAGKIEDVLFSNPGVDAERGAGTVVACYSSMQLTRAADYGVRAIVHLATMPERERALLPSLARATGAPPSFLSKVLQKLCAAGYVSSLRGKSGGFEILPRGRKVSLRKVIEAIDGPIHLNSCLAPGPTCPRKRFCPVHPVWERAQEAMITVLDSSSIAELAFQATKAAKKPH